MDPRVREHADVIVDHCTDIRPDDDVILDVSPAAEELELALAERIGEIGANPSFLSRNSRVKRAYLQASDPEDFETAGHELAAMEAADAVIVVKGARNASEMSDVSPETVAEYKAVREELGAERMKKRWVGTQFPAAGDAQRAEMSTEEYEEFVYEAVNKDWEAQREHQQQLVEILDDGADVRIVSGETTDIRMSIEGMTPINDNGEKNLPGGEVFTSPVVDSVEGEVLFDKPVVRQGRKIENAYLRFEDGEVVEHDAERNAEMLASILDTDEGARRLGELGIGMNRDIDQFTSNMLFDEKMGDTVHLAIGRGFDMCVPDDVEANQSATHVDMIVDMAEDSFIEVDGEIIQRDGTFRFEDGFEG